MTGRLYLEHRDPVIAVLKGRVDNDGDQASVTRLNSLLNHLNVLTYMGCEVAMYVNAHVSTLGVCAS